MKKLIPLILITILLSNCNNSEKQAAAQKAREQFIADSVSQSIQSAAAAAAAAKQALENQKAEAQKTISALTEQQYQLQQANAQAKANLTAAQDNLRSVSEFHLLRNSGERQAEIRNASLKVNELQQSITNLQQQYIEVQNNLQAAKEKLASLQQQ